MASFDYEAEAVQHHHYYHHYHQQLMKLDGRRGKRQRMDDPNDALLAHALLETVRQALDDSGLDADADTDVAAATVAPPPSPVRPTRPLGPHPPFSPDPDQDPIAYVRVDGQRHGAASKRGERGEGSSYGGLLPAPYEETARQALLACDLDLNAATWARGLSAAAVAAMDHGLLLPQHPQVKDPFGSAGPAHLTHAETPSHGSEYTNVETGGDGWGELGTGSERGLGAAAGDLEQYGVVDRPDLTSTDDGNEGRVPLKRQHSPKAGIPGGPCAHCGTTESPQWRRPLTKKVVLCNACGIYFSRHHSLPKRKKLAAAAGSHAAPRSARAAGPAGVHRHPTRPPLPPPTPTPLLTIICEEELELEIEAEDASPLLVPGAAGFSSDEAAAAAAPPPQYSLRSRRGQILAAGMTVAPLGAAGNMHGKELPQPMGQPCNPALFLPIMTALPVVGGLGALVDSFLNPKPSPPSR